MPELPSAFRDFQAEQPDVHKAYEALSAAAQRAGPLDERTRQLVKLAIAVGSRLEGAVRSHARRATEAGVSPEELDHVVMLSVTTIGLPSMMAARTWVRGAHEKR
jgi:AhpD family alkylhydroperoxidase